MQSGDPRQHDQPGGVALFRTLETNDKPRDPGAGGRVLPSGSTRRLTREEARLDRVHGAEGIIPSPLWLVLFFAGRRHLRLHAFLRRPKRARLTSRLSRSARSWRSSARCSLVLAAARPPVSARAPEDSQPVAMERTLEADRRGAARRRSDRSDPVRRDGDRAVNEKEARDGVELVATVLLSVATVATAWSAYQANRWNGEQAKAAARANAARIESTRASGVANCQVQIDVASLHAVHRRVRPGADGARRVLPRPLPRRVQARVRGVGGDDAAYQPGRAADPVRAPVSTGSRRTTRPSGWRRNADAYAAEARLNIQRSSNYILGVVLFASALSSPG